LLINMEDDGLLLSHKNRTRGTKQIVASDGNYQVRDWKGKTPAMRLWEMGRAGP